MYILNIYVLENHASFTLTYLDLFDISVWADADTWFERQQQEEDTKKLQTEQDATAAKVEAATKYALAKAAQDADIETEEETEIRDDPMAQAEAIALSGNGS